MANEVKIYSTCRACVGTGIDDQTGGSCSNCVGSGQVQAVDGLVAQGSKISGDFFDDVITNFSDINDRCDTIEEKIAEVKTVVDEIKVLVDAL